MEKRFPDQMNYLDASIRTAQYLSGLTTQQDVWSETGKVLVNFFGADMGGIGERGADGEITGRQWTFAERFSGRISLDGESREAISEVLESGFLALRIIYTPEPLSLVFLPITRENRVIAVMLAGHATSEPLPKELLNLYLAVAGLFGTTASRLASEREVRRHRQNLEQLVKERTEELTNANEHLRREITQRNLAEDALEKARDAAEAANRAKSAFLANMSHELRTPLNAILGFTQFMGRDEALSQSMRKNLAIVNRNGEHLLAMINDLLDLSRIEAGKTELTPEPFDLPRAIEDVAGMIRFRASSKGLDIIVDLDPGIDRHIRADPGKLRQVLINLLGNAVKFTETGRVTLRGRTTPLGDIPCRRLLEVEVEDTGPGIADEKMEEIFDPFTQAGPANTSQKGTGLGLTISRSFVQLMDGELTVESKEGKGSIFRLRMPVDAVSEFEAYSAGTPQPEEMCLGLGNHFLYDGVDPVKRLLATEAVPPAVPDSTELAALPRETVGRIRESAMELNKEEILAIAVEIEGAHPTVAAFIKGEAVSYNFEAIERLMESGKGEQTH